MPANRCSWAIVSCVAWLAAMAGVQVYRGRVGDSYVLIGVAVAYTVLDMAVNRRSSLIYQVVVWLLLPPRDP